MAFLKSYSPLSHVRTVVLEYLKLIIDRPNVRAFKMTILSYLNIFIYLLGNCAANELGVTLPNYGADSLMQRLKHLCPYNNFCESNSLKTIEEPDKEPCCEKCSCKNDCFETGNCCPDMFGSANPKFACKHLWEFGNIPMIFYEKDMILYWYHVIDECPEITSTVSYSKCYVPTELQNYEMVLDKRTGKLYRNRHCAECNNITKYDPLKLQVICMETFFSSFFGITTVAERNSFLMANCSLRSVPPENSIGTSHCIPDDIVISTCNYSGKWDIYDSMTETGCKTQKMVYRHPSTNTFYANVFCFICNVPVGTKREDICKIQQLSQSSKSGYVYISALLDFKMLGDDDQQSEATNCYKTQIWDSYTKLCRQVFCPAGQLPLYGRCQGLFRNINGYSLSINFDVIFKSGTIAVHSVLANILKDRVTKSLGEDISCGLCRFSLSNEDISSTQILYRHEIFTTDGCPYYTLLERIRQLALDKKILLRFKYKSQVIIVLLNFIFEETVSRTNMLFESVLSFCKRVQSIDTSVLLYCPKIELPVEEVHALKITNLANHTTTASIYKNETGTIVQQICVDSYFSAVKLISSASLSIHDITTKRMHEILGILLLSFVLE